MGMFLRNINPMAVKKIDEIKKKKICYQDFFERRLRKERGTERDKGL
ncbi:hypothetical protein ACFW0L_29015 [Priestia megaterium]|nr:hypothetical protein [Priestia megaterium]